MSFCPSNDIHSLYLDDELPQTYKAEYEEHLKTCSICQKKLEQLKALQSVFKDDAKNIPCDKEFLDKSFDRLMIKMSYSKNALNNKSSKSSSFKYIVSAAAAAAVFALVLPLRLSTSAKAENNIGSDIVANSVLAVAPGIEYPTAIKGSAVPIVAGTSVSNKSKVSANNVSFDSGRSILLSGNIDESVLSSSAQKTKSIVSKNSMIKNVDVLKPDIKNDETISIRITVPGIDSTPVVTEISLPVEVLSGRH